ncbi:MAG: thermonuclease family protein [Deltaproteobacteria bacterium]|nr:thermonuclease family protein [Deltaproteobacteria bacterium]
MGYNTLETHGAVHQWGDWAASGLLALTVGATQVAASKVRHCTSEGRPDGYGRPLVRCPDVARDLVDQGLAMVFAVKETPDPDLVARQAAAQAKRRGLWQRGVPETIVTSVHSAGDNAIAENAGNKRNGNRTTAYNRIVNTRTGETMQVRHEQILQTCQVVCHGTGTDRSCMTYVPFGRQRRNQPDCLH